MEVLTCIYSGLSLNVLLCLYIFLLHLKSTELLLPQKKLFLLGVSKFSHPNSSLDIKSHRSLHTFVLLAAHVVSVLLKSF